MKVALELLHGRTNPAEDMQDWGTDGPIFLVDWVHVTYDTVIRFGLGTYDEGELWYVEDLLFYDGVYYGDWSVVPEDTVEGEPRVIAFNPCKARPPERRTP